MIELTKYNLFQGHENFESGHEYDAFNFDTHRDLFIRLALCKVLMVYEFSLALGHEQVSVFR